MERSGPVQMITDPDPGGPKTYGSGTLAKYTGTYRNMVKEGICNITGKSRMDRFLKYIAGSVRHSRTKFLVMQCRIIIPWLCNRIPVLYANTSDKEWRFTQRAEPFFFKYLHLELAWDSWENFLVGRAQVRSNYTT
jgi:hypothetical protein